MINNYLNKLPRITWFWAEIGETCGPVNCLTFELAEQLRMIKENIATSLRIGEDDFDYAPFHERGGIVRAYGLFRLDLGRLMNELNEAMAG